MKSLERALNRRQFCSAIAATLVPLPARGLFSPFFETTRPAISQTHAGFTLHAPFDHPFYQWPRTLLSYPVEQAQPNQTEGELTCVETGETALFQISAMPDELDQKVGPHLLFVADLPSGATRTYRKSTKPAASKTVRLKLTSEGKRITIDCGPIQIRIPASQSISGEAPGPLLEFFRDGRWTGASTLTIASHPIVSIQTEQIEAGPLRSTHRLTYTTQTGHTYVATVQCIAGSDYVRLAENMEDLPHDAQGEFNFAWTGCEFKYRQAPDHPFNFPNAIRKSYSDYPWEPIAPYYADNQFGVVRGIDDNGKLPFSLLIFDPWADVLAASFASFWTDTSPFAAAIFIDRPAEWEDHEYAIWHESYRLAVDFVYRESTLHFVWRITQGTRSTCVSFYDHARDLQAMDKLEQQSRGITGTGGARYTTGMFPTSYALNLQNWQGTLSLDKLKDWVLAYPEAGPRPKPVFTASPFADAAHFLKSVDASDFVNQLALSGVRQNGGFGPTGSRVVADDWIPGYQIFRTQLSPAERRHVEGILLLLAYVHADEDYMPMQRMLSGHPNFLSGVKALSAGLTFLFPDHPAADEWANEFESYVILNQRYHTRPAVQAWDAKGGRWTENLGTYIWACLRPALRADFLMKCRDGQERMATPQLALMGDWLVNALTAPFAGESAETLAIIAGQIAQNAGAKRHYWGIVHLADGPRRVHPPVGAHSDRRKTPRTMWYLGTTLRDYAPLTAEHLMWAARPTDQDLETPLDEPNAWDAMYRQPDNLGTNPHLRTAKYTGYGITLRAAVDTPQELSILLVQIDDGPNYRWGNGSEGSNGLIYFFAAGKGYSHNGVEDTGDRIDQDTDFGCNFGVWKKGAFHSIGQNVLSRPLYDLSTAQFAEVASRNGADTYSWPEYVSRSILLAGDDYFILFDKVFSPQIAHRFSWFVRKGDAFPHITLLTTITNAETEPRTKIETDNTIGMWAEGAGNSLAFITHKENIQAEKASFGGRVHLPDGDDLVFLSATNIDFQEDFQKQASAFSGTSGIIRHRKDSTELALFHGTTIAAAGLTLTTPDTDLGISAKLSPGSLPGGVYSAPSASEVTFGLLHHPADLALYIDGEQIATQSIGEHMRARIPAGRHTWELATGLPRPIAPTIRATEAASGGGVVHLQPVASATSYECEISADNAATWHRAGTANEPLFKLGGLENGKKYHVRAIAINASHRSTAGDEYPLYVTDDLPSAPTGLQVELAAGTATLTWGEVLGVTEYRLHRRKRGEPTFRTAYAGPLTTWTDHDPAIVASAASPRSTDFPKPPACEYFVTTINHNGESKPSRLSNTDPASWRNWNPTPGEPFRRTVERTGLLLPNDGAGRYYPQ